MTIENDIDFILEGIEIAKQEAMKPLRELRYVYSQDGSNYEEAKKFIHKIANSEQILGRKCAQDLISPVAVKHKIDCSLGEYGNGQFILLNESSWYSGYSVGDWISSSESC